MSVAPAQRTLLACRIQERCWTVEEFTEEFNRAARRSLPGGRDHAISLGQAKRWVAGQIDRPHPASRRVLETMFATDARDLLQPPPSAPPQRDSSRTAPTDLVQHAEPDDDGHTRLTGPGEVSATRRRDLLNAGVLLTATGTVIGPAERAARISRAIAAAGPDPLTLAQLQHGIHRLTTLYAVTPHGDLIDPIERAWDDAEILLGACRPGPTRQDLDLVAGRYAYYRGQLAFDMGDDHTALTFFVLAAQHADAARDSLLSGSVIVMRSAVAFFAGDYPAAADLAQQGQRGAHPYIVPKLASALARARAQIGDTDGALAALRTMRDNIWTGPPQPGPEAGGEEGFEAFSAATLGYLGRGDQAEHHARRSLALLDGSGRHVQIAGTYLALARAFIHRQRPDPEQAASAVRDALTAASGNDHGATTTRAAGIYRRLTAEPGWTRLPAVRDLGNQLPNRAALPARASV
ncbi:hypothetical protein I6A60_25240 [Frankia sp. AgB1.9]|uniref:hypothetical protein n=1 Tax=unclassified Frankia TaxID=2632575 RepID=UPI001931DD12|nr:MULTISPECIES: hypothetical protein [unclassified Frankia]MBL7491630.1 hypothetical protein [Frankia sp. AgW1.1]MBL7551144.1 hypothetical protein [Frankia sp. AgB1.9]MBL7621869.1 hypothetical protein [Frankia sp. AgB1.8]